MPSQKTANPLRALTSVARPAARASRTGSRESRNMRIGQSAPPNRCRIPPPFRYGNRRPRRSTSKSAAGTSRATRRPAHSAAGPNSPRVGWAPAWPVWKNPTRPSLSTANQQESIEWAAGKSSDIGRALEPVPGGLIWLAILEAGDKPGPLGLPAGDRADGDAVRGDVSGRGRVRGVAREELVRLQGGGRGEPNAREPDPLPLRPQIGRELIHVKRAGRDHIPVIEVRRPLRPGGVVVPVQEHAHLVRRPGPEGIVVRPEDLPLKFLEQAGPTHRHRDEPVLLREQGGHVAGVVHGVPEGVHRVGGRVVDVGHFSSGFLGTGGGSFRAGAAGSANRKSGFSLRSAGSAARYSASLPGIGRTSLWPGAKHPTASSQ